MNAIQESGIATLAFDFDSFEDALLHVAVTAKRKSPGELFAECETVLIKSFMPSTYEINPSLIRTLFSVLIAPDLSAMKVFRGTQLVADISSRMKVPAVHSHLCAVMDSNIDHDDAAAVQLIELNEFSVRNVLSGNRGIVLSHL